MNVTDDRQTDRRQRDRRATANTEREREFTFADKTNYKALTGGGTDHFSDILGDRDFSAN